MKPGYQTSEHALTWAVVALAGVALFRGRPGELDSLAAVLAPALASAAYSVSRGRVKAPPAPFVDGPADAHGVGRLLGEMFRGRVVK